MTLHINNETNAEIGGQLISGALSYKIVPTYLEMMRYNLHAITSALNP